MTGGLKRSLALALACSTVPAGTASLAGPASVVSGPASGPLVVRQGSSAIQPTSVLVERLCDHGYDLLYNLDFPDALSTFQQAIAADSRDPAPYRGVATTTWLQILFQRGVVSVDDYIGHTTTGDRKLDQPPAEQATRFRTNVDRALALAEEAVRGNPRSAAAHYGIGSAVGLRATYTATVEGRVIRALSAARRACYLEIGPALL